MALKGGVGAISDSSKTFVKVAGGGGSGAAADLEQQVQKLLAVAQVAVWASLGRTLALSPAQRQRLCIAVVAEDTKYAKLLQSLVEFARDEDPAGYEAAAEVLAIAVAEVKRRHPGKPTQTMRSLVDICAAVQSGKDVFDKVAKKFLLFDRSLDYAAGFPD